MDKLDIRAWGDIVDSDDPIDRLAYFVNGLSPHNLWKGVEAIQDLITEEKIAELDRAFIKNPPILVEELSTEGLEQYWNEYYERRISELEQQKEKS